MNANQTQKADFLFMIEQAIKAPSGHNTQPWLFKINPDSIEIHPDYSKSLPVVDFDNRELFISLGCAAENLCLAASYKGYKPDLYLSNRNIIQINLFKDKSLEKPSLFTQIKERQTNRSVYDGRRIPEDVVNKLKSIDMESGVSLNFYENGSTDYTTITDFVTEGNRLQMNNKDFTDELKSWMRYNKADQDSRNDGLSYAVFGAPNIPYFIAKLVMSLAINSSSQIKNDLKKILSSSHFALFTAQENEQKTWVSLGRTLQRFLLKSTELGISHAYLNQPNEIKELSVKMGEAIQANGFTSILLRIGYGRKAAYSKRKRIEDVVIQ